MKVNIQIELETGMIFKNEGDYYILSCISSKNEYSLINLQSGNRWSDLGTIEKLRGIIHKEEFEYVGYADKILRINGGK